LVQFALNDYYSHLFGYVSDSLIFSIFGEEADFDPDGLHAPPVMAVASVFGMQPYFNPTRKKIEIIAAP